MVKKTTYKADWGETCASCAADFGECAYDLICRPGETALSCIDEHPFGHYERRVWSCGDGDSRLLHHLASPELILSLLEVDVILAHHHGRRTSSSSAWIEVFAPVDGLVRNAIAGTNFSVTGVTKTAPVSRALDAGAMTGRFRDPTRGSTIDSVDRG